MYTAFSVWACIRNAYVVQNLVGVKHSTFDLVYTTGNLTRLNFKETTEPTAFNNLPWLYAQHNQAEIIIHVLKNENKNPFNEAFLESRSEPDKSNIAPTVRRDSKL